MKRIKTKFNLLAFSLLIILTTLSGCGSSDRTADGDFRITDAISTSTSTDNQQKYGFVVLNEAGEVVEDALVTFNGVQARTNQKGCVTFQRPQSKEVNLMYSCDGYENIRITNYRVKNTTVDTITLKSKQLDSRRLKKALLNKKYDLLDNCKKIFKSDKNKCNYSIQVAAIKNNSSIESYSLCQKVIKNGSENIHVIQTSTNGNFENINIQKFEVGTNIFVKVLDKSGISECTALNLEIANDLTYTTDTEMNLFGDGFSFDVADNYPIVGGTKISFDAPKFPIFTKIIQDEDGNPTIRMGINLSEDTINNDESYKKFKEDFNKESAYLRQDISSLSNTIKQLKKYQARTGIFNFSTFNKIEGPEITLTGYVESGFNSYGEPSTGSGQICVSIKQKVVDFDWQCVLYVVPVTVNVTGQVTADFSGAITYSYEENELTGELKTTIKPEISVSAGVGFKEASAGLKGDVEMLIEWIIASSTEKSGITSIDLDSTLSLYGKFLIFKSEKKLLSGSLNLYTRKDGGKKKTFKKQFKTINLNEVSSYEPISLVRSKHKSSETVSNEKYDETLLCDNAYQNAAPVIASGKNNKMMIYTAQEDDSNSLYPNTKLYYSTNTDGEWTDAIQMDDENICQMNPTIYQKDNKYYIAYQETSFDLSKFDNFNNLNDDEKTSLIFDFNKSINIHVKMYNPTDEVFTDLGVVASNGEYDYNPIIKTSNNKIVVSWLQNNTGDIFGENPDTHYSIMNAELSDSGWKLNTVKESDFIISNYSATQNSTNTISYLYTVDTDGDFTTSDDNKTYLLCNDSENCVYTGEVDWITSKDSTDIDESEFFILDKNQIYLITESQKVNNIISGINVPNANFVATNNGIYFIQSEKEYSNIYFSKKNEDGTYCSPVKITEESNWITDISLDKSNEMDSIICISDCYDLEALQTTNSSIRVYDIKDFYDLSVEGAFYDHQQDTANNVSDEDIADNATSGDVILDDESENTPNENFRCTLMNRGTKPIEKVALKLYDASDNSIEIKEIEDIMLAPGDSIQLNYQLNLPENVSFGNWTLECNIVDMDNSTFIDEDNEERTDEKGSEIETEEETEEDTEEDTKEAIENDIVYIDEENHDNNRHAFQAGASDFCVTSSLHNTGSYTFLLVETSNKGNISDSGTLNIINADNPSNVLYSCDISDLDPGAVDIRKIRIKEEWVDRNGKLAILSRFSSGEKEIVEDNNNSYEYATMNYGQYKITYYLNGGKNNSSNPTIYTTNTLFTLKAPTRSGYTFNGWYRNKNFAATSYVTTIQHGQAGNIALYAKWTQNKVVPKKTIKAPEKVAWSSIKNIKKYTLQLKWKKKSGATGYQIQYALNKKFTKKKVTKTTKKTSLKIKKLKKKKTYYVRVRAYKQSGNVKKYDAWSKVKKKKITK